MSDSLSFRSFTSPEIDHESRPSAHDDDATRTLLESATSSSTMSCQGYAICTLKTMAVLISPHSAKTKVAYCDSDSEDRGRHSALSPACYALPSHWDLGKWIGKSDHSSSRVPKIYTAVLVFITQTLATRRSLQRSQMLTTTHDNTAAWAGIGAAISLLRNPTKDHISLTFNSTRTYSIPTRSLPHFNVAPDADNQVCQVAILDSQTQQIYAVTPDITKTTSQWSPYLDGPQVELEGVPFPNVTDTNMLMNMWQEWYLNIPASTFELDYSSPSSHTLSLAEIYFIQKLNLPAAAGHYTRNVTLHDFENIISTVIASVFWTCEYSSTLDLALLSTCLRIANMTEIYAETQLELSIIAVSAGLVVSLVLMVVAFPLLRGGFDGDLPINGTGILQSIWLYRNHPDLQRLLEQVEHPTDEDLRAAGMVQTRLVGDSEGMREKRV
ncbi:hypothetical protein C8R45DRAFT_929524 [Mycena sanguinolenta]|nr:hypothetical protein C8R45DRAFT_929524 [Mycena sanguinolenta]